MKTGTLTLLILLLGITSTGAAANPYGPYYQDRHQGMMPPAQASGPAVVLEAGVNKLTAFIRSGDGRDRVKAMAFLKQEIAPYFDFAYMTQWAAGPNWRRMNAQQRAAMQQQLAQSFLTTLSQKLTTYNNQKIRFFTQRGQRGNDVTVSAWIMQPNGHPLKLDFRFYDGKQGWKIFDVKAAGNSAVIYYRNYFNRMLPQPGQARYYN